MRFPKYLCDGRFERKYEHDGYLIHNYVVVEYEGMNLSVELRHTNADSSGRFKVKIKNKSTEQIIKTFKHNKKQRAIDFMMEEMKNWKIRDVVGMN